MDSGRGLDLIPFFTLCGMEIMDPLSLGLRRGYDAFSPLFLCVIAKWTSKEIRTCWERGSDPSQYFCDDLNPLIKVRDVIVDSVYINVRIEWGCIELDPFKSPK